LVSEKIKKLGYGIAGNAEPLSVLREHLYFVEGMHCASCEVLIERKLLDMKGIKSVEAKTSKGEVLIEYAGEKPKAKLLNSIFKKENYIFSDEPMVDKPLTGNNLSTIILISLLLIIGFLFLNRLGLSRLVNVNSKSSLIAFFAFGIIAGISSCAALVGGIILSLSKQWADIYADKQSTLEKFKPHIMFNSGRVLAYGILGSLLGALGGKLQVSLKFTSFFIIGISLLMLLLGLQMLGVKRLRKFQFTLPRVFTRYIADETNFKGRYMPFIMGTLTFFLPCGFTITAQGIALLSGNFIQGGLIMAFFALGTAPTLLFIGLSAIKFSSRPKFALQFSKIAGILILFFALFNINNQLNVLGAPSLNDINTISSKPNENNGTVSGKDLAPIVDGKQVLKMDASASGYQPNYFKVVAGSPVRWEINDKGTSGCTNAIISKSLFDGEIALTPGQTSIKEFMPAKPGKYKFSCWMGMVSGTIEVVDGKTAAKSSGVNAQAPNIDDNAVIPSGAKDCGCGGGGR